MLTTSSSSPGTASRPVIVLGAGGHALVVWDVLESMGHRVVGFTTPDLAPGVSITVGKQSRPVLGDDAVLDDAFCRDPALRAIAGTGPDPLKVRRLVTERIDAFGPERTLVARHPGSVLAQATEVGGGTVIMAGAVVNPGTVIDRHCVVNTGATLDHECVLGENVFIGPGAHLAGRVIVGDGAVVGIGASVKERVRIGRHAYVGGGAFVNRDVPDGVIVVGVPARVLRKRE